MSLSSRTLRRSVLGLSCLLPAVCAAQPGQFNVPAVVPTGNWPANIAAGVADNSGKPSLASCDPYVAGVALACHLYQFSCGAWIATETYPLPGAVAAKAVIVADPALGLNGVAILSVQDAIPATSSTFAIQYYADGMGTPTTAVASTPGFPLRVPKLGDFAYRPSPASPLQPGLFIATDSANGYFYLLDISSSGLASTLISAMPSSIYGPNPSQAGAILPNLYPTTGPHGLRPAFAVVSQDRSSVGVVLMNPDGTWAPLPTKEYTGSGTVYSALLADMDGDGIADLVLEGANGRIDIYHGLSDGTFVTASEGGSGTLDGMTGNGGHLAAVDPGTHNVLAATPIGLSVLQPQSGTLTYGLKGIYNIGPGRSSFALADLYGTGTLDLAVDSPEGIAIVQPDANGDGGFQTSQAYSTLAPALGATVGRFRNSASNPGFYLDVVANTGAVQAQLLTNSGNGTFATFPGVTNLASGQSVALNLWSNILSGDFNGDGNLDIAYSLTGLPLPAQVPGVAPGLYVQYGNGNGTFQKWVGVNSLAIDDFYGESTVGDFNGDGIEDIANIDADYDATLLGQRANFFTFGLNAPAANTAFSQVAAGFFKVNPIRASKQDLVFQQGSSLIPYLNSGNGVLFTPETPLQGTPPASQLVVGALMIADVDGDGNGDIVAVYYNPNLNPATTPPVAANQLYIWWGNGDGTFTAPFVLPLTRNDYLGAVGDMNSDGKPDLVLSDGQIVTILYNLGGRTGAFRSDFGTTCAVCGEQHFLAGQGINSISLAPVTGNSKFDLVVANGGVTISNPLALGGATASSIALTANPDVNTGGITVLANNITTSPVTGTVVATPSTMSQGTAFTLTATLFSSPGVAEPTGFVEFFVGTSGTPVSGFVPLTKGTTSSTASFPVTAAANTYAPGTYAISAFYSGDANNSQLPLNGTLTITNTGTTTTLYLCIGPTAACPSTGSPTVPAPPWPTMLSMYYGQSFNGITGATANDGSALSATSVIDFNDAYNGAPPVTECTLAIGPPLVPCPPAVGTTVGTGVGTHIFTSVYLGDATHAGSTSIPVTITVVPDLVPATISSSANPVAVGQPISITAIFTGNYAAPSGLVQFTVSSPTFSGLVGVAQLMIPPTGNSSVAILFISGATLPVGTYTITASYAATTDFGAASATLTQVVKSPSFIFSVTPTAVTDLIGSGAVLTITVTAQNGFTQTVNLACANLPPEATCNFIPPAITGGGSSILIVNSAAPHTCGTTQPYFVDGGGIGRPLAPIALPALAGLLALFLPRRRRWLRVLIVLAAAAVAVQITGCGNCTDLGTRPGTYTFQVTGTFAGQGPSIPPETQSVPITLTVTL